MANELCGWLLHAAALLTAALLAALLLRRPLRALAGPAVAYAAWLLVPLVLAVASLPLPAAYATLPALAAPAAGLAAALAPAAAPASRAALLLALATWLGGAAVMLAWYVRQYRAYRNALGPLHRRHGVRYFRAPRQGPALLGVWRPALVLPAGFAQRYTRQERKLVLAHELAHARRGDPWANAFCAALQCLFWFHPLLHWCVSAFRTDQELACDDTVMRAPGMTRRAYAAAMLKTQLTHQGTPLACAWQSHPLKERILNLQRAAIHPFRRRIGQAALALSLAGAALLAWSAHAAPALAAAASSDLYDIALTIRTGGASYAPRLRVHAGERAGVRIGDQGAAWNIQYLVTPADAGSVKVQLGLRQNGREQGMPAVLVALGAPARVATDIGNEAGVDMTMVITRAEAR